MSKLTTRSLASMKLSETQSDRGARGGGTLIARGLVNGVLFYFRYTAPNKKRELIPLGSYSESGRDGLSLPAARAEAATLSKRLIGGERDLKAALGAESRENERKRAAVLKAEQIKDQQKAATLGVLLTAYISQLLRDGKPSARAVQLAAARHIEKAWPVLWATPADEITVDDLVSIVAKVVNGGKLREAAKLRSYLGAAYAAAKRARHNAKGMQALRDLKITNNPARDLGTIEGSSKSRERELSLKELRAYWQRLKTMGDAGALLRFHLLTGAQRAEQLARATVDDLDKDECVLMLRDIKGNRTNNPRKHAVPLLPAAMDEINTLRAGRLGPYLVTLNVGESGAAYSCYQVRISDVCDKMMKAGELEGGRFTYGDLRRTVETRLSAAGVSRDIRAQLQSHGIHGVQARHYDKHHYLPEKRAALETLWRLITDKNKVIKVKFGKSAA
jgi:hypothetical protein